MVRAGMTADEAGDAPVVHHIVDVLNGAFSLGISALIVQPEIVAEGNICDRIHKRAKALRVYRLANDAVLECEVMAARSHPEAVPPAPFNRDMVEDHICAAGDVDRAFAPVSPDALAKAQETDNHVARTAERNRLAIKGNAVAWRRLAGNCDVIRNCD